MVVFGKLSIKISGYFNLRVYHVTIHVSMSNIVFKYFLSPLTMLPSYRDEVTAVVTFSSQVILRFVINLYNCRLYLITKNI